MNKNLIADLNKTLRLGTESDVTPNTENVDADDLVRECDTVSANSIENTEEAAATNDIIDDVDDQMDSAEAVEDLTAAVESASNSGKPLTRIEAAALTIAFAQATRKHYKDPVSLLPARESNQAYAMSDLNLAQESLKETASDLYKKAVAAIKEILKKVGDFIKKFIDKYGFLARRFGACLKAANEATADPNGKVPVKTNTFIKNGKVNKEMVLGAVNVVEQMDSDVLFGDVTSIIGEKDISSDDSSHKEIFQRISTKVRVDMESVGEIIKNNGNAPENIRDYVLIQGNKFLGSEAIGETDLLVLKIGSLTKTDDAEIVGESKEDIQTLVEVIPNKRIKEVSKQGFELTKRLRANRGKVAREWRVENVLKGFKTSVNADETLDTSEKTQAKTLVKYVAATSKYLQDLSLYGYNILSGVAEYLEACLKASAIDADSTEVENPKEEVAA